MSSVNLAIPGGSYGLILWLIVERGGDTDTPHRRGRPRSAQDTAALAVAPDRRRAGPSCGRPVRLSGMRYCTRGRESPVSRNRRFAQTRAAARRMRAIL